MFSFRLQPADAEFDDVLAVGNVAEQDSMAVVDARAPNAGRLEFFRQLASLAVG